jgi:hypothetical protein
LVRLERPAHDGRAHAPRTGPYGGCVYRCDNNVVDHQVVAMEFANGVEATMTVSAFTSEVMRTEQGARRVATTAVQDSRTARRPRG